MKKCLQFRGVVRLQRRRPGFDGGQIASAGSAPSRRPDKISSRIRRFMPGSSSGGGSLVRVSGTTPPTRSRAGPNAAPAITSLRKCIPAGFATAPRSPRRRTDRERDHQNPSTCRVFPAVIVWPMGRKMVGRQQRHASNCGSNAHGRLRPKARLILRNSPIPTAVAVAADASAGTVRAAGQRHHQTHGVPKPSVASTGGRDHPDAQPARGAPAVRRCISR